MYMYNSVHYCESYKVIQTYLHIRTLVLDSTQVGNATVPSFCLGGGGGGGGGGGEMCSKLYEVSI